MKIYDKSQDEYLQRQQVIMELCVDIHTPSSQKRADKNYFRKFLASCFLALVSALTRVNHCHEIRSSVVSNAIVKMKSDKISDNGLVYSNNFIFGTNLLYRCLSILFTSMIHHGFASQAFICANIIPIPKSAK